MSVYPPGTSRTFRTFDDALAASPYLKDLRCMLKVCPHRLLPGRMPGAVNNSIMRLPFAACLASVAWVEAPK